MNLPSDFLWIPNFVPMDECLVHELGLIQHTPWEDHVFKMHGRQVAMPRRIAFYGEHSYSYSGITHPARPMTDSIDKLRREIEELAGEPFNCVLLNYYRDGKDSVSWHSDDDYHNGGHPVVASLSFGAARKFKVRRKDRSEQFDLNLTPGSLLLMLKRAQLDWEHSIPKTKKNIGPRVNLTFRYMAC